MTAELLQHIVTDPAICFGRPTIKGHRIWVSLILGYLADGWTTDQVLTEFPQRRNDDVSACLAYNGTRDGV